MATTAINLYRGAAATSNTTLYSTVANTVVTNIIATNTTAVAATFTINLDGVALVTSGTLSGYTSAFLDIKQVVTSGKVISGSASATSVNFHIGGVTIV